MAFVTTQTAVVQQGGYTPAIIKIYGTYASSAGGTGGTITPGYTNSSTTLTAVADASAGARDIVGNAGVVITPGTEDVTTPKIAIAYDTTVDRDQITLTTVANGTGTYIIECYDNGA